MALEIGDSNACMQHDGRQQSPAGSIRYVFLQHCTMKYCFTVQCSTIQYSTVEYSRVEYSTVQCSTHEGEVERDDSTY